mgnify:FL=1
MQPTRFFSSSSVCHLAELSRGDVPACSRAPRSRLFAKTRKFVLFLALVATLLTGGRASPADAQPDLPSRGPVAWRDIQVGGFFSQGFLASSANNYLGETSHGTFDFREYALNASYAVGRWRVGAQAFGQKLGDYGDDRISLDWAMVDYQAAQWLGFRAGRVKMPRGLYNEALDLDSVRPFVLLPQSIYDNRLRDFNASFDGVMIYGNFGLKRFGSLDYTLYGGDTPIKADSGASDFFNTDSPFKNLSIGIGALGGGTLFWNTPIHGLRAGYSHTTYRKLTAFRHIVIPAISLDEVTAKTAPALEHNQLSIEYVQGNWTFAVEAAHEHAVYAVGKVGEFFIEDKTDLFYASAARRINRWLELGSYYSVSREHYRHNTPGVGIIPPLLEQNDFAISARFDLNEHVVFKLESHSLKGTGKIFNTASQPNPLSSLDPSWTMIAAKVTFSF